jgi:hypothetical protein
LRDERSGNVDEANSAKIAGGYETCYVSDDSAADANEN